MQLYRRLRLPRLQGSRTPCTPAGDQNHLLRLSDLFASASPFAAQYLPQVQALAADFGIPYAPLQLQVVTNAFSSDPEVLRLLDVRRVAAVLQRAMEHHAAAAQFGCQLARAVQHDPPGAPLRGAAGQLLDHLCGCAFWGQGPRTPASYLAWGLRYLGHHSAPGVRLLAGLLQDPDAQQMAAEGLVAAAGADPSLLPELLACLPVSHASCDAVLQVAEELAFAPDMAAFFVARCGEMVPLCASFERRAAFLDCLRACIAHLSAEDYLDLGGCLTGLLAAWDDEDLRERMDLMGEDFGVQLGWYWRVQQW
ncbi:hypothetical protein SS50377_24255 [Spironucleus salmonicida]|uniref:Uncharacterized protein n=1 Tax=Spironucleus salmonicida TaxID=348837 RepID=A0A9P8LU48_9EUKA|nr:hypothetical protein SS50377_24255 [Spironucleus salmonicida]